MQFTNQKQSREKHRQIVFCYKRPIVLLEDICTSAACVRRCSRERSSLRNSRENKESVGDKVTHTHSGCQIIAERHFFSLCFFISVFLSTRFSRAVAMLRPSINRDLLCTQKKKETTTKNKHTKQSIKQCNGMLTIKM